MVRKLYINESSKILESTKATNRMKKNKVFIKLEKLLNKYNYTLRQAYLNDNGIPLVDFKPNEQTDVFVCCDYKGNLEIYSKGFRGDIDDAESTVSKMNNAISLLSKLETIDFSKLPTFDELLA